MEKCTTTFAPDWVDCWWFLNILERLMGSRKVEKEDEGWFMVIGYGRQATYRRWCRLRRRRRSRRRCRRKDPACRARPTSPPEGPTSTRASSSRTTSLSLPEVRRQAGDPSRFLSLSGSGVKRDGGESGGLAGQAGVLRYGRNSAPDQPRDSCTRCFYATVTMFFPELRMRKVSSELISPFVSFSVRKNI